MVLGKRISFTSVISKGSRLSGDIVIGKRVFIDENVRIGGKVRIGDGCKIDRDIEVAGNITIGENTVIGSYSVLTTMPEGHLRVGNDVSIGSFSVIGACEHVDIGDHCIFAAYVQVTDASHGIDDPDQAIKHALFVTKPVMIEQNVWLGSGVMVMKGVSIGAGSVIGAKALVTRNIPPLSVAYGIPAMVKRVRSASKQP